MTKRYRFPSQLDYEITSVDHANDWLLMQKAGESRQGKVHPVTLIGDMSEQVNGYKFYAPGVSPASPVYSFQFDSNTGIGSSAVDTINFISGGVSVAKLSATGGFFPNANNTYDLGTSTYAWKGAYLQQFLAFDNTNTLIGNSSGEIYFQTNNTPRCGINTAGHFVPSTSAAYDLGSTTYKWRDAHFSGTIAAGHIRPQTDNAYDLGSVTYSWKDLYLQGVLVLTTSSTLIGLSSGSIYFQTGGTPRGGWDSLGNLTPAINSTSSTSGYYCGTSSYKWRAVYAYNGTIQTSDVRDKTAIETSDLGLEFIRALTPRSYSWADIPKKPERPSWVTAAAELPPASSEPDQPLGAAPAPQPEVTRHKTLDDGRHYGLIAQEVRDVLKGKSFAGYVYEEDIDEYFLNYAEFISPLIRAVQELSDKVAALEAQLETGKGK